MSDDNVVPIADFETRIQKAAERHLDACWQAMSDREDLDDEFAVDVEDPSYGPFCGCTTCVVREVLSVTYDEMLKQAKREAIADKTGRYRDALERIARQRPSQDGAVRYALEALGK